MSITRMREKGQVTIPASLRKSLNLQEDAVLSVAMAGGAIILSPRPSKFDAVAREFSRRAEKKGISLDDLLKDLRAIRHRKTAT